MLHQQVLKGKLRESAAMATGIVLRKPVETQTSPVQVIPERE